jgi:DNA-binding XRE family transcriptional regulator
VADRDVPQRVLGKRIRDWRRFFGLTRLELASAAGIAYDSIKDIETGRCGSQSQTCIKLAAALGIPRDLMISRNPIEAISFGCVQQALYAFAEWRVFEPERSGVASYSQRRQAESGLGQQSVSVGAGAQAEAA